MAPKLKQVAMNHSLDQTAVHILLLLLIYNHLYSPCNMVAQAHNTGTSKNTTNEKEKK